MFVQSLLVLLVAIQVISACKCQPFTKHQAMCSQETVIMAAAMTKEAADRHGNTVEPSQAEFTKYRMEVHVIYKEGAIPLTHNGSRYFDILTPFHANDCGVLLALHEEYHLSGTVAWTNGPMMMSSCSLVHLVPWTTVSKEEFHCNNDLLTGQTEPKCEPFCVVFKEGVMHRC